jgi:hypothetical protein
VVSEILVQSQIKRKQKRASNPPRDVARAPIKIAALPYTINEDSRHWCRRCLTDWFVSEVLHALLVD